MQLEAVVPFSSLVAARRQYLQYEEFTEAIVRHPLSREDSRGRQLSGAHR